MPDVVRDRDAMVAGMSPVLKEGEYVFASTGDPTLAERARPGALSWFVEDEGLALIVDKRMAASLGFDVSLPMRRIVLEVFSALDGVGLTAVVSTALADAGIPCNIISAFHHDSVFVPSAMADDALLVLRDLQTRAEPGAAQ